MKKQIAAGLALSSAILFVSAAPAMAEEHWAIDGNVTVHPAESEVPLWFTTTCSNAGKETVCGGEGVDGSGGVELSVLGQPLVTSSYEAEDRDGAPPDPSEGEAPEETDLPDPL